MLKRVLLTSASVIGGVFLGSFEQLVNSKPILLTWMLAAMFFGRLKSYKYPIADISDAALFMFVGLHSMMLFKNLEVQTICLLMIMDFNLCILKYYQRYINVDPLFNMLDRKFKCVFCDDTFWNSYQCAKTGKICCYDCLTDWIRVKRNDPYGPVSPHGEVGCFDGCGAVLTVDRLTRELPSHKMSVVNNYADQVTNNMLRQNQSIVWCPCGTVFELENDLRRGNMMTCLIECQGCKRQLCIGCGDNVKERNRKGLRPVHQCQIVRLSRGDQRCLGCGAVVTKIDGCDRVRCSMCLTTFVYNE